jgi:uncharacterized membrane protein YqiK
MMSLAIVIVGLALAVSILVNIPKLRGTPLRAGAAAGALVVFVLFFWISSFRYVGEDAAGIVVKNIGAKLPSGNIIAVNGEMGPQAEILGPGWHPLLWPFVYDVEKAEVQEILDGKVGLITTTDGKPLPPGEIFAADWTSEEFQQMLRAEHFLDIGGGFKGPQAAVLRPGKYRINPKLFRVAIVPATNIAKATVGVVKSNVGKAAEDAGQQADGLVDKGQRGIWRQPLMPQMYYLNTKAFEVTVISTAKMVMRYTKQNDQGEEKEITVRSADGFTFPVDVRVEYEIRPGDASLVVANFGEHGDALQNRLNSAVRAIFRNNAETVKALDYVQQRSTQERQSQTLLSEEMSKVGVSVTAVRIGDVGDEATLGVLLKTQTDREIALQEQETFQEQQRTAEQQKALTKTQQEAVEEKRLATAAYEVEIAREQMKSKVIEAEGQAEALRINAEAKAKAFEIVAEQIGPGNAALIELLNIIGKRNIQITPRVMVTSGASGAAAGDAQSTALIGTMLDSMMSRSLPSQKQAGD